MDRQTTSDAIGSRIWQLTLRTRRQELLGPLDHIVEVSERLSEYGTETNRRDMVRNMETVRDAARAARLELLRLTGEEIHQGLSSAEASPSSSSGTSSSPGTEHLQPSASPPTVERTADETTEQDVRRAHLRHDLRNRLNLVLGYSEEWREILDGNAPREVIEDLQIVYRAGRNCLRHLDEIFAPPGQVAQRDTSDIRDIIQDALRMPARRASELGHILIVDDDRLNRDVLRRRLERIGHSVKEVETAAAALAMVDQEQFDLVLLDVILRGNHTHALASTAESNASENNGFHVLAQLKRHAQHASVPIILLSALHEPEIIAHAIALGAEDYLSRPVDPVLLQARVESCLEKVRLREREQQHLREIEVQRRRADELLHVLLPEKVIAVLKQTNEIPPRRYDRIAVIFADICGFTRYCDRRPPEEVITKLAHVVESWEDAAVRFGVQKVKTIGDAFMGACGLFEDVENPVEACLHCGLAMIRETQARVPEWNLRVGIHFGEVVGGKVGRQQYLFDLWGDTVNTAARMESHGDPGTVTLSTQAWHCVSKHWIAEPAEVDIKSKGMQQVYRVALKADAASQ